MAMLELFLWLVQQVLSCLYSVTSFGTIARRYIRDDSIRGYRSCIQVEKPAVKISRPHGEELPKAQASSTELRIFTMCVRKRVGFTKVGLCLDCVRSGGQHKTHSKAV